MKIGGIVLEAPKPRPVVIPRNGHNFVFEIGPVRQSDWEAFSQLCPEPEPPYIRRRGENEEKPDFTDKDFMKRRQEYLELRLNYMFIVSLNYTPDLEFDLVKLDDPSTWTNFAQELELAGLSAVEASKIMEEIRNVNGLNPDMIEEATQAFIARRELEASSA